MATNIALEPVEELSRPLLDSLPAPLEALNTTINHRIIHMCVSPDNCILAMVLSDWKRKHEDYIALYHLDCRAIFRRLNPQVNEDAIGSNGAPVGSINIYYCTFLDEKLLLVGWEVDALRLTARYLQMVDTESGVWELWCDPWIILPRLIPSQPHFYRNKNWLYMLSHESPREFDRYMLYCFSLQAREICWRQEMEINANISTIYYNFVCPYFAAYKDNIFIFAVFDKVFRYDMKTWALHLESLNPDPEYGYPEQYLKYRQDYGFSAHRENVYIAGGFIGPVDETGKPKGKLLSRQDIWQLNLDTLSWFKFTSNLPYGSLVSTMCLYAAPESLMSSSVIEFFFGSCESTRTMEVLEPRYNSDEQSSTMSSNFAPSNSLFSWRVGLPSLEVLTWRVIRSRYAQGILQESVNSSLQSYLPWFYRKRLQLWSRKKYFWGKGDTIHTNQ